MPFTIDGMWIASQADQSEKKPRPKKEGLPLKVRLQKRGKNLVTVILNLNKSDKEIDLIASLVKKKLGVGGAVKPECIEIQGDKVEEVMKILSSIGLKCC
jgi:translation initiation factor 1